MQVSQKTQKIIAIVCGLLLLGVIVAILVNKSNDDKPKQSATSQSETKNKSDTKTDKKEVPKKDETAKPKEDSKPADKSKGTKPNKPDAPKAPQQKQKTDTKATEAPKQKTGSKNFVYTAKPGDSYTALARDAIEEYATANKVTITSAQKLQIESDLAVNAGLPLLEIGQVVEIEKEAVSAAIKAVIPAEIKPEEAKPNAPKDSKETKTTAADYNFTAVAGDSYSKLARSAIADYASKVKLELSPAQKIAAETTIIAAAGFPEVDTDQVVTYTSASIKDAVDASKRLTQAQLSNWQPYAVLAGL